MKEYKIWRDEEKKTFNAQTHVDFSKCSKNGCMSFMEILKFTSDMAGEDFTYQGISRKVLNDAGFAMLVSRVSFKIINAPKENQDITLITWEEKPEPLQFLRAYQLRDTQTDELLVDGLSSWLLVDFKEHKILPCKKFNLKPLSEFTGEHQCMKPSKIKPCDNMQKIGERKIMYSDLDCYGHTNNAKYINFVFDALPLEYSEKKFTDFKLNYSKEAKLNEVIELDAAFNDEEKIITVIGKKESEVSFECELYYE